MMAAPERFPTIMPSPFASNDERWAAVVNRDRSARAEFVYSWRRPASIAARAARPDPRRERALPRLLRGRRARRLKAMPAVPSQRAIARGTPCGSGGGCRLIHTAEELPDLDALAGAVASRFHFHRIFKVATGCTPRAYVAAHRAARMRNALRTSQTVTDAIYDAGFNSNGRFYAASSEILGMAPATFMRGGPGGRARVCFQPARRRNPLPPGGPDRRRARRLSLGRGTQAGPARP